MELDSSKLIQKLNFINNDLEEINKKLNHQDEMFLTLFSQMTTLIRNVNKLQKKKPSRAKHRSSGKKATAVTKQKEGTDFTNLLHLQKALQQNITTFTRDFSFKPTTIPEELLLEECLSDNECQTICAKESPVDQVRMLIRKMKGRSLETINKFLNIIKKEFPQIEKAVRECYENNVERSELSSKCAICMLTTTVDPKDIADHLWESGLIQDDLYGCITESDGAVSRLALWDVVIQYLNQARDPNHAKTTLEESLKQKYDHLVQPVSDHKGQHALLTCSCRPRKLYSETSVGSQTDVSSVHWKRYNVPLIVQSIDSQTTSESESYPSTDSKEVLLTHGSSLGYFDPNSYVRQFELAVDAKRATTQCGDDAPMSPDSTVPDSRLAPQGTDLEPTNDRSRHSSGKFQPLDSEQCHSGQFPSLPFVDSTEFNRYCEEAFPVDGSKVNRAATTNTPTLNIGAGNDVVSSSTDIARLSSDTITPDTDKRISLPSDGTTDTSESKRKSSDQEKLSPDIFFPKFKLAPPRSQVYRVASFSTDDEGNDEDDHETIKDHFRKRARHKKIKKKLPLRQLSAPADCNLHEITSSRSPSESKVGTRKPLLRITKGSKKRLDRRKRANKKKIQDFWDPEKSEFSASVPAVESSSISQEQSREPGIPYNPSWSHHPQPRQSGKWDHHQGRVFWRMAQLQAAAGKHGQFHSDSDLLTEDGDELLLTDDNTV